MCVEHLVNYQCKHAKGRYWKYCEDARKMLSGEDQLAMSRRGVLKCPREGGTKQVYSTCSGPVALIGAKIDQATKAVNKKFSSTVFPATGFLPATGCKLCHGVTELTRLILDEKFSSWIKIFDKAKRFEEELNGNEAELAEDSDRKRYIDSARQLEKALNIRGASRDLMMSEPLTPVNVKALLMAPKQEQSLPAEAGSRDQA